MSIAPVDPTQAGSNLKAFHEALEFIKSFNPAQYSAETVPNAEVQLDRLKALGREASISNRLTCEILDDIVGKFILNEVSQYATMEGLTIIANGLVLNQALLANWNPEKAFPVVLKEFEKADRSLKENYLLGRLLFLFTFNGILLADYLLDDCVNIVNQKLDKALDNVHSLASTVEINPMLRLSFIEVMKFAFNLVHHYPDRVLLLFRNEVIGKVSHVFMHIKPIAVENVDITRYIFNTLMCVPVESWFDNEKHQPIILTNILEFGKLVTDRSSPQFHNEHTISPCFTCLEMVVSHVWTSMPGSAESRKLKSIARKYLEPTEEDRQKAVGNTDSLASNLLHLTNVIGLQSCNRLVQEVYLVIFDRNQQRLTEDMGFGFASRFLGLTGLEPAVEETSLDQRPETQFDKTTSKTELKTATSSGSKPETLDSPGSSLQASNSPLSQSSQPQPQPKPQAQPTNPITGQYLSAELHDTRKQQAQREWDAMTDAEKEQEGERVLGLLDRLKKNGIIQVANPVEVMAAARGAGTDLTDKADTK